VISLQWQAMTTPRATRTSLRDAADLLAVVWSVPLAVLLVGAPVALAVAVVLWLGRWARSVF